MTLTFGSLFAGVGGFDLGFEAAGWLPRWQVEWDRNCQSVLTRRWPEVTRYGDVRDVMGGICDSEHGDRQERQGRSRREWLESDGHVHPASIRSARRGDLLEPVDCITYGFPCQDLSVAGHRAGLDGVRSGLFFEAVRIIKEMRDATGGTYPTWAVAENVPGLLNADGGDAMGRCLDALADIGAVGIEWAVLDAQHFGVPQRRRRVFIVAWFDPRYGSTGEILPVRARCGGHPGTRESERPSPPDQLAVSARTNSGISGTVGTSVRNCADREPAFVKVVKLKNEEHWESRQYAPTLNCHDNTHEARATVLAEGVRRLSPRECERLMGWPDDHTRWNANGMEMNDTARYRMCGNGVVAPVAEWIAKRLMEAAR